MAADGAFETNASAPGILMTPTINVNVNDVPIIGRPFFSSAYIMVDLDANTWTLWQANATTETRLVSVGGDCAEKPKVNTSPQQPKMPTGGVTVSNGTLSNSTDSATDPTSSDGALNEPAKTMTTGAIVGVAIGAAFGAGLLAGASVICFLKRRRHMRSSASETDVVLTKDGHELDALTTNWHEKPVEPPELSALQNHSHELPVTEWPSEASGGHWDSRPVELPSTNTPRT